VVACLVVSGTVVTRARAAEVASGFRPIRRGGRPGRLRQADHQGVAVAEDADDLGAASALPIEPLLVGVRPGRAVHHDPGVPTSAIWSRQYAPEVETSSTV